MQYIKESAKVRYVYSMQCNAMQCIKEWAKVRYVYSMQYNAMYKRVGKSNICVQHAMQMTNAGQTKNFAHLGMGTKICNAIV